MKAHSFGIWVEDPFDVDEFYRETHREQHPHSQEGCLFKFVYEGFSETIDRMEQDSLLVLKYLESGKACVVPEESESMNYMLNKLKSVTKVMEKICEH